MTEEVYKFYMEASLDPLEATEELKKEVASVIKLPTDEEKQPDLSYFSSIFVSKGTNLNNAHFMTSELIAAENTVVAKPVDIEHQEDQIIGHIYSREFIDGEGNRLDLEDLRKENASDVFDGDLHIAIASVIYKTRFPEIAKEIEDKEWKVSMEVLYKDFDVMVGDTIFTKEEAILMGFDVYNASNFGEKARVVKDGKTIASGKIVKVLRGLCFSGVGIVKKPANPPSIILDTASKDDVIEFDMDKIEDNKVTISKVEDAKKAKAELEHKDTVGICVNYKYELLDSITKDQDTNVLAKSWCTRYDTECPVAGDATDTRCLRKQVNYMVSSLVDEYIAERDSELALEKLTKDLINKLKQIR